MRGRWGAGSMCTPRERAVRIQELSEKYGVDTYIPVLKLEGVDGYSWHQSEDVAWEWNLSTGSLRCIYCKNELDRDAIHPCSNESCQKLAALSDRVWA